MDLPAVSFVVMLEYSNLNKPYKREKQTNLAWRFSRITLKLPLVLPSKDIYQNFFFFNSMENPVPFAFHSLTIVHSFAHYFPFIRANEKWTLVPPFIRLCWCILANSLYAKVCFACGNIVIILSRVRVLLVQQVKQL